jgi:hypothetical protein
MSSSGWPAGQSIPSWTRAKWMWHTVFAVINRETFSTDTPGPVACDRGYFLQSNATITPTPAAIINDCSGLART